MNEKIPITKQHNVSEISLDTYIEYAVAVERDLICTTEKSDMTYD